MQIINVSASEKSTRYNIPKVLVKSFHLDIMKGTGKRDQPETWSVNLKCRDFSTEEIDAAATTTKPVSK